MNKLILVIQTSIDGYIADENGNTDWMIWNWGTDWTWDKKLQTYYTSLTKSTPQILISGKMAAEGFIKHWQSAAFDNADLRNEFALHIVNSKKYVASKKLSKTTDIPGGWSNTEVLQENLKTAIQNLKKQNKGDIVVYGGATLVSSLIRINLIDEYIFFVNPVIKGKGMSIFKDISMPEMKLQSATAFDCGLVVQHYLK